MREEEEEGGGTGGRSPAIPFTCRGGRVGASSLHLLISLNISLLSLAEGWGATGRRTGAVVESDGGVGAPDLNANGGPVGRRSAAWLERQRSSQTSDKQANCRGEYDRCNKPPKKRKKGKEKRNVLIYIYYILTDISSLL